MFINQSRDVRHGIIESFEYFIIQNATNVTATRTTTYIFYNKKKIKLKTKLNQYIIFV